MFSALSAYGITCLLLAQTSAPAATGEPTGRAAPNANAAWRELFAQDPPRDADRDPKPEANRDANRPGNRDANRRIDAVLAACGGSAQRVKALIASDDAYEELKPSVRKERTRVADGNKPYDVEFLVYVPRGYDPKKPWPLVLSCHGQGGSGSHAAAMAQQLLGPDRDKYVVVAPTMPGPEVYSGKPYQEQAYLQPLEWARRRLHIDGGRVYVTGYSLGGHNTWHLATMYGRLFAAAVPMAGSPVFEGAPYTCNSYMENLGNLPLWAIWGEEDTAPPPATQGNVDVCRLAAARLKELGNAEFKGTELPGAGHGECFPPPSEFRKFLEAGKREPVPQNFTHTFHLWHHRRGYYLEAVALTRPPLNLEHGIRVELPASLGHKPTTKEVLDAGEKILTKSLFRFSAELDRPHNALTVKADGVRVLRLYVMEGMFDLSQPVTIRFGEKAWQGKIVPSARAMLQHYSAERDAAAIVLNELDLDAGGRVAVRFKD